LHALPLMLDALLKLRIRDLEAVFCRQAGAHGLEFRVALDGQGSPLLRR